MFVSNKIIATSPCGHYVVISTRNYVDHLPGLRRTSYRSEIEEVLQLVNNGSLPHDCFPSRQDNDSFVGVFSAQLKKLKPNWFIDVDELLMQYQTMQREGAPITDPDLLALAKNLWSLRVSALQKNSSK